MQSLLSKIRRFFSKTLLKLNDNKLIADFFALYGIQLAILVLPLITLPFVARKLGPTNLGYFAIVQALSLSLYIIVEYGFSFSATRFIAENSANNKVISAFTSSVLYAKGLLSVVVLFISVLIYLLVEKFQSDPKLFVAGILYAVIQGLSPLWFFQGIGRMTRVASIDAVARILGTLAIFIVLKNKDQAWLILSLQSFFILMGYVAAYRLLSKEVSLQFVSVQDAVFVLKNNFSLFLFRIMSSIINTANSLILSIYASPVQVGYFYNADKLSVGARSFMIPINQLVFPKVSQALGYDLELAKNFFRRSLVVMLSISLVIAIVLFFLAPSLIILLLGKEYSPSIKLFQILVLATPLFAIGNALGMQWMIPNKFDRAYNIIIGFAAVFGLITIVYLAPMFKALGIIAGFICSELFVCCAIIFFLNKKVQNPFKKRNGNI